jgi:hypothetical protein
MPQSGDLPSAVHEAFAALTSPHPMRRGSLSERFMKCNRPGCPCAERADARHGPYFSLTRAVDGRTRSRLLSAAQAEIVREQVAAGQRFRTQIDAYWAACERWADAELEQPAAADAEAGKKKSSARPLRRKSRPRSRRS